MGGGCGSGGEGEADGGKGVCGKFVEGWIWDGGKRKDCGGGGVVVV